VDETREGVHQQAVAVVGNEVENDVPAGADEVVLPGVVGQDDASVRRIAAGGDDGAAGGGPLTPGSPPPPPPPAPERNSRPARSSR
jgi:hypothetical protein